MQDPRSSLALIVPPVEISRWERLAFVPTAALVFGFGIWIADLFVVYAGISPLRPEVMLRSAGTLLFFSALIGLGLAIPLTSLAALLTLRSSSAVESGRVPPSGPEAAGDALLLVALTGAYGVAFRFGGRALLRGVVRELFQAWGIVGLSFGLLAASALLFVVLRPSARALSIWLAPRPYVGWPWRHRASLLLSVGALALIASALAFLLRAGGGAIIPITDLLRVLFALLLGLGAALGARIPRARIWLLALICSLLVFALAGGGVLAFSLRSEDALARRLVFERGLSGRLAGRLTLALADPDDDGFAQVFGGGDCAPQDPSRHPMALELPENGIDEDCDGVDLSPLPLPPPATFAPPNGASIPRRPDLVLITVGEMSPRDLAAHGAAPSRMPRLDRRIEAGAYFDSCFAQGPATRLALPSLFSSRYDSELPRRRGPRPPYSTTCSGCRLAEHLQSLRFDTVAVISSAHLSRGRWPSLTGGFERIEAGAIRAPDRARRVTADVLRVFATRREKSLFVWAHYPSIEGSTDAAIEALIAGI
ncbi:MAG: MopE-related protein, partial [Myxococcales bacterium]|nr:MopE-related protein [Myxococcales bacterium]